VKEDVLVMFGLHGLRIRDGVLHFDPSGLYKSDFLNEEREVELFDLSGSVRKMTLKVGELVFTCCQTPIVYQLVGDDQGEKGMEVVLRDGSIHPSDELSLTPEWSQSLFLRKDQIEYIRVYVSVD
jgi:hypothetical protein